MKGTPSLLLVHGSWHGPWCWQNLLPELARLGLTAATVALPSCGTDPARLGTLADDAAAVEAAVAGLSGDVVIVAHSYAGMVVSQARLPARVRHLVYLGAFLPEVGQSLAALLPPGPLPPFVVSRPDGATEVAPALAVDTFYADCDARTAAWAVGKLRLHNGLCNVTPVSRANWNAIASTYIVLADDHASPTFLQRDWARRLPDQRELPGSHSPFLARPAALAEMLAQIAAAVPA